MVFRFGVYFFLTDFKKDRKFSTNPIEANASVDWMLKAIFYYKSRKLCYAINPWNSWIIIIQM